MRYLQFFTIYYYFFFYYFIFIFSFYFYFSLFFFINYKHTNKIYYYLIKKKIIINSKKFKISDLKINNVNDLKIIEFLKYQKKKILKIKTLIKKKKVINKI